MKNKRVLKGLNYGENICFILSRMDLGREMGVARKEVKLHLKWSDYGRKNMSLEKILEDKLISQQN